MISKASFPVDFFVAKRAHEAFLWEVTFMMVLCQVGPPMPDIDGAVCINHSIINRIFVLSYLFSSKS